MTIERVLKNKYIPFSSPDQGAKFDQRFGTPVWPETLIHTHVPARSLLFSWFANSLLRIRKLGCGDQGDPHSTKERSDLGFVGRGKRVRIVKIHP